MSWKHLDDTLADSSLNQHLSFVYDLNTYMTEININGLLNLIMLVYYVQAHT